MLYAPFNLSPGFTLNIPFTQMTPFSRYIFTFGNTKLHLNLTFFIKVHF